MRKKPQIIEDVGFDFHWDVEKVWKLNIPTEEISIDELTWHFNVPFLWSKPDGYYDLKPQDVIDHPDMYKDEYARTMNVDLSYPIDIMHWRGKWLILDGLHRLMKANIDQLKSVKVRKVDKKYIHQIEK